MRLLIIALALAGCAQDFTEDQLLDMSIDELRRHCTLVELRGAREQFKCGEHDVYYNNEPPLGMYELRDQDESAAALLGFCGKPQ